MLDDLSRITNTQLSEEIKKTTTLINETAQHPSDKNYYVLRDYLSELKAIDSYRTSTGMRFDDLG